MASYALLLRGINVGGNKKIAMAALRDLLSGLGFTDVRTYLQSGNAVFTSPDTDAARPGGAGQPAGQAGGAGLAGRIEAAIASELGLTVRCLVVDREHLRTVIDNNPLRDIATNGSRMMALFLFEPLDPAVLAAHDPGELAPAEIALGDRVIYQWCPDGIMEAPDVGKFLVKHFKVAGTARNWNTVTRIGALLDELPG